MKQYSLVVVASKPPPIAGQSLATGMLLEHLQKVQLPYKVIDLARGFYLDSPVLARLARLGRVASLPIELLKHMGELGDSPAVFYLQHGHGRAAILRDMPLIMLASAKNWPIILHVHGGGWRLAYEYLSPPLRRIVRLVINQADCIVVLSETLRQMFKDIVPDSKVTVVPNGAPDGIDRHAEKMPARGEPESPMTVLFLSNLMREKGYITMLETALMCYAQKVPVRFVIAGGETETTDVHPDSFIETHELDNTDFVGRVTGREKLHLLQEADVFALPTSATEAQPLAIIEAMHFGLPVITTRAGGIVDLVDHEEQGLFVPAGDPAAITSTVQRLLDDPELYQVLSKGGRERARCQHTAAAHGAAMVRLFDEVAHEIYGLKVVSDSS